MDDFRRGTGMLEKNLQKALMHLYANVDRYSSYSEGIFEEFALSPSEKDSLKQLMTSQRSGLLLFNEQLHGKRRRLLRDVLPLSASCSALDSNPCWMTICPSNPPKAPAILTIRSDPLRNTPAPGLTRAPFRGNSS